MTTPRPWRVFGRAYKRGLIISLALLCTLPAGSALAQDQVEAAPKANDLGLAIGGTGLPLEITADGGIEWEQRRAVIRARGNARAVHGDVAVNADMLSAYYRDSAAGAAEIWRLEADGDVRITTPTDTAFAERGQYDVDSAVLVLSGGNPVRLVGKDGEVRADRQMEYWQAKRMVVARGDAVAVQGDKTIRADVLVAYLREGAEGKTELDRVEAFDRVHIITAEEDVHGTRGVYDAASGKAALTGDVRITRGKNQLNGCRAEVDLKSGVSKLFGCGDGGVGRVRGLIQPEQDNKK
ncbi:MAG: hypothetical protein IPM60_13330 [Rhodospirillales bacterium]|nr:hypothetical protein [Rhodospirillales bacterium]